MMEIEECVLRDCSHFYAVTLHGAARVPIGSEVRIIDVQGGQLLVQVRGETGKQWVKSDVVCGKKKEGEVDVPECLHSRVTEDPVAGEVNTIHNHIAAKLGVRVKERLAAGITPVKITWRLSATSSCSSRSVMFFASSSLKRG
jgi:hypothetical protein